MQLEKGIRLQEIGKWYPLAYNWKKVSVYTQSEKGINLQTIGKVYNFHSIRNSIHLHVKDKGIYLHVKGKEYALACNKTMVSPYMQLENSIHLHARGNWYVLG